MQGALVELLRRKVLKEDSGLLCTAQGREMRAGITTTAEDLRLVERIVSDRNIPQKQDVLLTAAGADTIRILRAGQVSKKAVWRSKGQFLACDADGLLRDETRPAETAPRCARCRPSTR